MLASQSLQATQNVSRAARIQMNQKIGGQGVFGVAGGTQQLAVNGGNFPASQFQNQKYKNMMEFQAPGTGQVNGILSNQRNKIGQPGGSTSNQEMRSLPTDKSKIAIGQTAHVQIPQFLNDSNHVMRKSR